MRRASDPFDSLSGLCPARDRGIPFTNAFGLRDYRAPAIDAARPWPLWCWLGVGFLLGLVCGGLR